MIIASDGRPDLKDVIEGMLDALRNALPGVPLSDPGITVLRAAERPVGLSNLRGNETFGPLPAILLKGGRLETAIVFEVLGADAAAADSAVLSLHGKLLGARNLLQASGFLRIDGGELSPAEKVQGGDDFRRTASYEILYEYQYRDVDGAASLITHIPVHSDPEERESPDRESRVVTGAAVRWDESGVPAVGVRGPASIRRLWALAFLPDVAPGHGVRVVRTFEGAEGEPTVVAGLDDLAAETHAQVEFPSITAFLAALPPADDAVELEGWEPNNAPDSYAIQSHAFTPAIQLSRLIDRFEVSTPLSTGWAGNPAVLYLRIERA